MDFFRTSLFELFAIKYDVHLESRGSCCTLQESEIQMPRFYHWRVVAYNGARLDVRSCQDVTALGLTILDLDARMEGAVVAVPRKV